MYTFTWRHRYCTFSACTFPRHLLSSQRIVHNMYICTNVHTYTRRTRNGSVIHTQFCFTQCWWERSCACNFGCPWCWTVVQRVDRDAIELWTRENSECRLFTHVGKHEFRIRPYDFLITISLVGRKFRSYNTTRYSIRLRVERSLKIYIYSLNMWTPISRTLASWIF